MGYTFTKDNDYEKIKEGEYEVYIEKIEMGSTSSGDPKIQLNYRVREDVEQEFKNRVVFDNIYLDKTNPNLFDTKKINKLLGSQADIQENQFFEDINAIINFLKGRNLRIKISYFKAKDDPSKDLQTISKYSLTHYPNKSFTQTQTSTTSNPNSFTEISEEDLPF